MDVDFIESVLFTGQVPVTELFVVLNGDHIDPGNAKVATIFLHIGDYQQKVISCVKNLNADYRCQTKGSTAS